MSGPAPAVDRPAAPWMKDRGILLAALALGVYAAMLAWHVGACAADADASGYLNHARLLAAGASRMPLRSLPGLPPDEYRHYLFAPLGLIPAPEGNGLVPSYPVGLPLLVAAAAPLFGWDRAGDAVMCAHGLLAVVLTFGLGRMMGLSRRASVLGAACVAVSPLTFFGSLQLMSDVPSLAWTLGAAMAAWQSRRRPAWALGAGAATAVAVLIRPTNALILAPVAVALGLSPRRWAGLVAGGLPGAIFLCLHNRALYGGYLSTGYGGFLAPLYRPRWIGVTLAHYAVWLPALATPVVALAAGLPLPGRRSPRMAAMLGAWALAYLAFYSAYEYTHDTWWYLRFVLPAFPPLVVGGLLVARAGLAGRRRALASDWIFVCALTLVAANGFAWSDHLSALKVGRKAEAYPEAAAWMRGHLPGNSVILAMQMTGAIEYYTGFTFVNWVFCHPDRRGRIFASVRESGRPFYAALFPFEVDAALREHMPGRWTRVATLTSGIEIWRLDFGGGTLPQ